MSTPAGHVTEARLIVRAGGQRFAVPATSVREIVPLPKLTRVPLAPSALLGLGAVRGETLAVLALGQMAGNHGTSHSDGATARRLLVLGGSVRAAVAVDAIERLDHSHERDAPKSEDLTTLAIDDLVSEVLPARQSSRRAISAVHARADEAAESRAAFLQVSIGMQVFALPLETVAEVILVPGDIALLADADAAVIGSIAWRGTTLGVLSLAVLLGLPVGAGAATSRRILVVDLEGYRFGVLVERVDAILRAAPERIDPVPPSLLRSDSEARISAIYRPGDGGRLVSILAAARLMSEARTRDLLAAQDRYDNRWITDTASAEAGRRAVLPITIGLDGLAFPLAAIREVTARPSRLTKLPGAPDWLAGVAMIGGAPLAIVDQVARLTGRAATGKGQRLLVVEVDGMRLGFLVDGIGRVVHCDASALTPAPLPGNLADGIFGDVLRIAGEAEGDTQRPMLLLEPSALISSAERALVERHAVAGAPNAS